MKDSYMSIVISLTLGAAFAPPVWAQEVLPFPPKPSGSTAGRTMQESIYSPLPAVNRLPKDAPNILIVLIDDVGPAQTDTYGGERGGRSEYYPSKVSAPVFRSCSGLVNEYRGRG